MRPEIAVHLGEDGKTASLYVKGKVTVFRKKKGKWTSWKEMEFMLDRGMGMSDTRERMKDVSSFIEGCTVFVGLNVSGVPYFELEKSNLSIWEYWGKPEDFLDQILEKEEEERLLLESREKIEVPVPEEISGGCYRVSIKRIQEGNTGITSKQVLLPFIRKGGFYSLEILCSHAPPWLEAEIKSGSLPGDIRMVSGDEVVVTIKNRCCL
ncbi:MAG: Fe-only nitrogenase accessory AnfO family protein [Bacillota bacterium]